MNFTLKIMGTASAMPISDRNPSAQALSVHGRLFLIDCGEGAQRQMRRMHLSFVKVEAIFISHIHGDHVFGLFGLLRSMAMYGRTGELYIYGPQALGSIVKFYESFFGTDGAFKIVFKAVKCREPQVVHESKAVRVSAFPLNHKIECYGYRFDEILTPKRALAAEGDSSIVPKSYAYCSDTAPFPELPGWVHGVDCLYHEATYMDSMSDKAEKYYHSTTCQAARCALEAGAGKLVVGHFSSRIVDFDAFKAECTAIFPDTIVARDGDEVEI